MSSAEASLRKFLGKPLATKRSQSQARNANVSSTAHLLTFGVELEFVLAIQDEEFAAPGYSWLYDPIQGNPEQSALEEAQWRTLGSRGNNNMTAAQRQHRIYRPLTWASRILDHHGMDHVVETGKLTDVQRWGIVPESTAGSEA